MVPAFAQTPRSGRQDRPPSNGTDKKDMWSSMLGGVANGKRLPEKNLIVLGGTPDLQKEFLEILASEESNRPYDRHRKKPPVANEFALGYTYQDVMDADHEDILARLSIYLLSEPSPSFAPLLKPLINPHTIPETMIVIIFSWIEPWLWVRQLREWIKLLREVVSSLDDESKTALEENMLEWQQRRGGASSYGTGGGSAGGDGNVTIPLSQGEWDEALGLPLCVVCQSTDKIEALEKEQGWREEEFDFILQFMRTILMKHGASLIYTSPASVNSLPTLIHSSLGIHSLLKKQQFKHNVIDRDRVLVPPNWDSWGKIRVLREGFDVEGISSSWSTEIQAPGGMFVESKSMPKATNDAYFDGDVKGSASVGVVSVYEDTIQDPRRVSFSEGRHKSQHGVEIEGLSTQEFLASQMEVMERLKAEEEQSHDGKVSKSAAGGSLISQEEDCQGVVEETGRVSEHIGPVQFNVGGIQVDADDMLKRLKDRGMEGTPERSLRTPASPEAKSQNEALASFFAGLMKRGGSNSPKAATQ